jgi:hypothetical protein
VFNFDFISIGTPHKEISPKVSTEVNQSKEPWSWGFLMSRPIHLPSGVKN